VPLSKEAVRAHLGSILSSTGFANADRISRFLQFTVEMKLRGEESQIKESVLGREVFDRGTDYDPRLDPIVRVEARRLRQRLAEYYDGPGKSDLLRIEFPKGGYAPLIQVAQGALQPEKRWKPVAAGALILIAVAAMLLLRPREPMVAVLPARWVWNDTGMLNPVDESLAESIIAHLANQGRVRVVGWPVVAGKRGSPRDLRLWGRELGVRTVLVVSVRQTRVTLFQLDAATGEKGNVQEYFPDNLNDYAARDKLANEIAAAYVPVKR